MMQPKKAGLAWGGFGMGWAWGGLGVWAGRGEGAVR